MTKTIHFAFTLFAIIFSSYTIADTFTFDLAVSTIDDKLSFEVKSKGAAGYAKTFDFPEGGTAELCTFEEGAVPDKENPLFFYSLDANGKLTFYFVPKHKLTFNVTSPYAVSLIELADDEGTWPARKYYIDFTPQNVPQNYHYEFGVRPNGQLELYDIPTSKHLKIDALWYTSHADSDLFLKSGDRYLAGNFFNNAQLMIRGNPNFVTSARLSNKGLIECEDDFTFKAHGIDNEKGQIKGFGKLKIETPGLNNKQGFIAGAAGTELSVGESYENAQGQIGYDKETKLTFEESFDRKIDNLGTLEGDEVYVIFKNKKLKVDKGYLKGSQKIEIITGESAELGLGNTLSEKAEENIRNLIFETKLCVIQAAAAAVGVQDCCGTLAFVMLENKFQLMAPFTTAGRAELWEDKERDIKTVDQILADYDLEPTREELIEKHKQKLNAMTQAMHRRFPGLAAWSSQFNFDQSFKDKMLVQAFDRLPQETKNTYAEEIKHERFHEKAQLIDLEHDISANTGLGIYTPHARLKPNQKLLAKNGKADFKVAEFIQEQGNTRGKNINIWAPLGISTGAAQNHPTESVVAFQSGSVTRYQTVIDVDHKKRAGGLWTVRKETPRQVANGTIPTITPHATNKLMSNGSALGAAETLTLKTNKWTHRGAASANDIIYDGKEDALFENGKAASENDFTFTGAGGVHLAPIKGNLGGGSQVLSDGSDLTVRGNLGATQAVNVTNIGSDLNYKTKDENIKLPEDNSKGTLPQQFVPTGQVPSIVQSFQPRLSLFSRRPKNNTVPAGASTIVRAPHNGTPKARTVKPGDAPLVGKHSAPQLTFMVGADGLVVGTQERYVPPLKSPIYRGLTFFSNTHFIRNTLDDILKLRAMPEFKLPSFTCIEQDVMRYRQDEAMAFYGKIAHAIADHVLRPLSITRLC